MSRDDDSRMLDSIYAAAWDPGALDDALRRLSRVCRSRSTGLFHLSGAELDWSHVYNMPASFMHDFAAIVPRDPRIAYALRLPPMTPLRDDLPALRRPLQAAGVDRFARDYDLPHTVGCNLGGDDANEALALFTSRSRREGPPDTAQIKAFSRYAPHFARAMALRRQMRGALSHAARAQATDTAPQSGALAMDGLGRVRWLDGGAEYLLTHSDGLSLAGGRLYFADARTAHRFDVRLRALIAGHPMANIDEIRIAQNHPAGTLTLRALPNMSAPRTDKRVLVLLRRLTTAAGVRALPTARQREVLTLLAQGLQSKQIARRLNIAENTVRNHVQDLLRLLDAPTRGACAARARELGWLE